MCSQNISNASLFFIESLYFPIGIVELATAENEVEEDIFEDMLEMLKLWNNLTDQGFWQLDFPAGLLWIQIRPPDPDQSGCLPESKRELRSKKEA